MTEEHVTDSAPLPQIVLVRHGETAWSTPGKHTGLSDLPLNEAGEKEAARLSLRLSKFTPDHVFTSSLLRARQTAELAGFAHASVDPDLVEWNYGAYEGLTSVEIRQQFPGWVVFRDGSPRGESVLQATQRADRVVAKLRTLTGNVLIFSHGHFSRVIAARWCGLELDICPYLLFNTTALSVLGYDRDLDHPVIRLWNVRESFVKSMELA
ncbi:histidine phosphatase family protein [Planctomicrobium sp. SH661]|uniref:histidine phosphatase family protein n=1 Tax=Planctomicrobium sp. SH661 TaxID=3448124 RepID=UPI003F5BF9A4